MNKLIKNNKKMPKRIAHKQFTMEQLENYLGQTFSVWIMKSRDDSKVIVDKLYKKDNMYYAGVLNLKYSRAFGKSAQWMKDEKGFEELFVFFYLEDLLMPCENCDNKELN